MEDLRLSIRPAVPTDAPAIAALTDAAYEKFVPRLGRKPRSMLADYAQLIAEHDVWVAIHADRCAGVLALENKPDHVLIYSVAVTPELQRAGIGRRLLALAESRARDKKLDRVCLYTNEHMTENIEYYLRAGYVEDRREPFMGSHTVYMSKRLSPTTGDNNGIS